MDQPLVSVIIPAYNAEAHLKQTLDSVLAQTWSKLEIIVVNDGSTDGTRAILNSFSDHLQIIDNDKKGASAARNKGLQVAKGKYIQFLDADDLLSSDKIEAQMQCLLAGDENDIGLCKTVQFFDGDDYLNKSPDYNWYYHDHDDTVDFLLKLYAGDDTMPGYGGFVQPNTWLTPRTVIDKAGPWNENLSTDDDGEFFCRVVLASSGIKFSAHGLNYYRKHRQEQSLSGYKTLSGFESRLLATDLKYQHLKAKSSDALLDKVFARMYWWLGVEAYPDYKNLSRSCINTGRQLGYTGQKYIGGAAGHLITKVFGWKFARLVSHYRHKKPEQPTISKNSSLISIDVLRCVAAMGVFFYHQHVGDLLNKYTKLPFFCLIDIFGAVYAVPLFFLLSGFCIHLSSIKYLKTNKPLRLTEYYKRRLLRIYPPYLLATVFALIVNYFTFTYTYSLADIATHILALQGFSASYFNSINVVLWTITVELGFYLLYPLFYYLRYKYGPGKALSLIFFVTIISIVGFSTQTVLSNPQRYFVLNLWFAWCCGAYLADLYLLSPQKIYSPLHFAAYIFIVIAFLGIRLTPFASPLITDQINILIWAFPLIFIVKNETWLLQRQNRVTKIIAKIGLSSYSLYLLHEPLITLKNYLVHQYLPAKFQITGMIIGIVMIPLICWYSFIFVEKPFSIRKKINEPAA